MNFFKGRTCLIEFFGITNFSQIYRYKTRNLWEDWDVTLIGTPILPGSALTDYDKNHLHHNHILYFHPWNFAVLHWYPNGISSMGLQQFFIGILNNFHNQKKELH